MQNLFGFLISDSGHYLFLPITYLVYRVWLLFYLYIYLYTNSPSLRLILLYSINLYLKIKAIETILNRTIYVNLTKKITIANKLVNPFYRKLRYYFDINSISIFPIHKHGNCGVKIYFRIQDLL